MAAMSAGARPRAVAIAFGDALWSLKPITHADGVRSDLGACRRSGAANGPAD